METIRRKRDRAIRRELLLLQMQEKELERAAEKAKPAAWKTMLESRIPEKVYAGLESAFCKGFAVVFSQGRGLIELSYNKKRIKADHAARDQAVQTRDGRKELKQMRQSAKQSELVNLAVTTAEGIGLGAAGIGMPDIVLFLSTLLKGIYETALNYGFDYESRQEQVLILKMMAASMSSGRAWVRLNAQVDKMLSGELPEAADAELEAQMKAAASAFAVDMLLLKFIQGTPVIGILGGAANPIYYNKVMKYVQLKYRKRYLLKQI